MDQLRRGPIPRSDMRSILAGLLTISAFGLVGLAIAGPAVRADYKPVECLPSFLVMEPDSAGLWRFEVRAMAQRYPTVREFVFPSPARCHEARVVALYFAERAATPTTVSPCL